MSVQDEQRERLVVEQIRADEVEKGDRIFEPLLQTFVDIESTEGVDMRRWNVAGWTSPYVLPDHMFLRVVPSPSEPDEGTTMAPRLHPMIIALEADLEQCGLERDEAQRVAQELGEMWKREKRVAGYA
jgi:hypothetical protein